MEQALEVCELMAEGVEMKNACAQVDVGFAQMRLWVFEHPEIRPTYRAAQAALANHLAGELMDEARANHAVDTGYLNAVKWRTATLDRETFGDRQTLSHEVAAPSALDQRIGGMSDDQVLSLIDSMIAAEGANAEEGQAVRIEAT